jgi:hypothetical protein
MRLSKVTDEAYFVRRLRARAGTVITPGPRFCLRGRSAVRASRLGLWLGARVTSGGLGSVGVRLVAVDAARVPALRGRATGRSRELALRVEPRIPPQLARPLPNLHP